METDQKALQEYRKKWTKQPMVVDREYLGSQKK